MGTIELFISIRPCKPCGGTGKIIVEEDMFTEYDDTQNFDQHQNEGTD